MKALIWTLTLSGVLPILVLTVGAAWSAGQMRSELDRVHPIDKEDEDVHRVLVSQSIWLGSWSMEWYPRPWAVITLALGVLLVVGGLFVLLHLDGLNRLTW